MTIIEEATPVPGQKKAVTAIKGLITGRREPITRGATKIIPDDDKMIAVEKFHSRPTAAEMPPPVALAKASAAPKVPRLRLPVTIEQTQNAAYLSCPRAATARVRCASDREAVHYQAGVTHRVVKAAEVGRTALKSPHINKATRNASPVASTSRLDSPYTARCVVPIHHPPEANLLPSRDAVTERSIHVQRSSQIDSLKSRNACEPQAYVYTSRIIAGRKRWTSIGLAVYRVGVGMYHSSLVVDDVEWHFWEGLGVVSAGRYYDPQLGIFRSVDHMPFVTYIAISTLMQCPQAVGELCKTLGTTRFTLHTYDLIRCNCNHFTQTALEKLGLFFKMPTWINRLAETADAICSRLPVIRRWIDATLDRKTRVLRCGPTADDHLSRNSNSVFVKVKDGSATHRGLFPNQSGILTERSGKTRVSKHTHRVSGIDNTLPEKIHTLAKKPSLRSIESDGTTVETLDCY